MKVIKLFYYLFIYIFLFVISSFGYSLLKKEFFFDAIFSFPYLAIAFILFAVCAFLCYKTKRITLSKTIIFFLTFFISIYSVFIYFPFLHFTNVPTFEKEAIIHHFIPGHITSNRKGNWNGDTIVAHSLGEIDGNRVTPSIETFITNYDKGFKTFEVDFVPTSDNHMVCRHLWEDPKLQEGIDLEHIPTLNQFKSTPILKKYTPLTFQDLCNLLQEYPDAWIITDTKENTKEEISNNFINIIGEAMNADALNVLDRFIIQVYDSQMYATIEEMYPFRNVIFATYRDWHGDILSFIRVCQFCNLNGINSISMWNYYYCDEIQEIADIYDIDIYIHTENDLSCAKKYLSIGARGIYTDFIRPEELK